jgi:cyclophilin family peptidyl-prolyl cis-trans isomerase
MPRFLLYVVTVVALVTIAACGQQNNQREESQMAQQEFRQAPGGDPSVGDSLVVIETTMGTITVELFVDQAPKHSENFKKLAREGFFNGTTFHRVIPGFVVQGGDPNSRSEDRSMHGRGGPGYTIPAEIGIDHQRGYLAAARLGDQVNPERESSGSQFYICLDDLPNLDGAYTVFGRVLEGMDVVDAIAQVQTDSNDNPVERVVMNNVTVRVKE